MVLRLKAVWMKSKTRDWDKGMVEARAIWKMPRKEHNTGLEGVGTYRAALWDNNNEIRIHSE